MSRSGIDVLATVKDGFAKRFAFKPLTASARVDEWPGRGQLGKLTSRVKISLARPDSDQFGRPLTAFNDWADVFPHAACTVTLVDRLVHRSEILEIDGDSYRLKEAKERQLQRSSSRRTKKPKP